MAHSTGLLGSHVYYTSEYTGARGRKPRNLDADRVLCPLAVRRECRIKAEYATVISSDHNRVIVQELGVGVCAFGNPSQVARVGKQVYPVSSGDE